MEKEGCFFDIIIYNILINGFGKVGFLNDVGCFFDWMKLKGCNFDVVIYSILIIVLGKVVRVESVCVLFEEMESVGI